MQDSKRLELMGKGLAWENVTKAKTNSAGHSLLEIAPRIEAMENESAALRAFAQAVMECWPMGDLDGGTLQDAAVAHGLLTPETRHEPCAEGCSCAENADAQEWSFGVICYRKTPLLTGSNAEVSR